MLVQHANNVPAGERPAAADAVKALWDNPISDDLLLSVGGVAWVVAAIAAAIAYRGLGAPTSGVVLLGLSAVVVVHAPPVGPIALVVFAAAVILLARDRVTEPAAETVEPTQAVAADA